ncbi:MAG: hypothetical protein NZ772_13705 [Cyanobacteria bacterium]|nr:hypothetical protein [Cyanobacteriota bacterium]MDW8202447.1 hypothetical protein [Cyanobacteriota bacterium SKYGB_h_bin112]
MQTWQQLTDLIICSYIYLFLHLMTVVSLADSNNTDKTSGQNLVEIAYTLAYYYSVRSPTQIFSA